MVGKYKVVTLCGSTKFKDEFIKEQKRLTLEGNIVISVGLFGHSGDDEVWSENTKEMLDDMHKRKIDMADEIFVINKGGYIGTSTKSEIEYALSTGKKVNFMEEPEFSLIEETVSFYTRNDFAILNNLLIGNDDGLFGFARVAYDDNRGILAEYESGARRLRSDYDIKWINALKKRVIGELDDGAKAVVVANAKKDIAIILNAMEATGEDLLLYRTAWIDGKSAGGGYAYSREYKSVDFCVGNTVDIKTFSSFSLTPYREDDEVGSDFYRYEMRVPRGTNVLLLDKYITHNEDGEVVLPPMKCRAVGFRKSDNKRCRGIVELEYVEQLPCGLK